MRYLIYGIPALFVLYKAYKSEKPYYLLLLPTLLFSFIGAEEIFPRLSFLIQFSLTIGIGITLVFYFIFLSKDIKKEKLDFVKNKKLDRIKQREIQEREPNRKQKIIIEDLKTKEKRVYWASTTVEERKFKEEDVKGNKETSLPSKEEQKEES
ncbi:hypothetical protein LQU94_07230 [Peptoniphilus sp. KCTC 25270]|uniref:hypothetical protein n=1 Tax=Peptoniphilus sp. KCTC 25270 TaxID=2897414 RepID=UPI001E61B210|nr:hypothetical protein [Peptoniphilus sp. KCTC 25270]MCD1147902.1 hypothetical protein [Peptoniphilus sp. KCTC 25270]